MICWSAFEFFSSWWCFRPGITILPGVKTCLGNYVMYKGNQNLWFRDIYILSQSAYTSSWCFAPQLCNRVLAWRLLYVWKDARTNQHAPHLVLVWRRDVAWLQELVGYTVARDGGRCVPASLFVLTNPSPRLRVLIIDSAVLVGFQQRRKTRRSSY